MNMPSNIKMTSWGSRRYFSKEADPDCSLDSATEGQPEKKKDPVGPRIPTLMYHSIIADDAAEVPEEWSQRHTVSFSSFLAQLDFLVEGGWQTIPPEALEQTPELRKPVIITFDDGHSSDLLAAEALHGRGLQAAFFVTWSNLGRPNFLSQRDLRGLDRLGFKIGSHGLTHVGLVELGPEELCRQLIESRERLESLLGKPITDFAVPYGRYNRQVIIAALAVGYRRVMTSTFGYAKSGNGNVIPRLGINSTTTLEDFRVLLAGRWIDVTRRRILHSISRRLDCLPFNGWGFPKSNS